MDRTNVQPRDGARGVSIVNGIANDSIPFLRLKSAAESDFVRKVFETFMTRIGLIGIGLVTSIIVARILGPEGRGRYAVAAAVSSLIIQFGNLGLPTSNTYSVSRDGKLLPALLGNALAVSFLLGGFCALSAGMALFVFPNLVAISGSLLILALIGVPFGLGQTLAQNLLIGIQDIRTYNKIELATAVFGAALLGILIVTGVVTVESVFLVGILGVLLAFLWTFRRLYRLLDAPVCVSFPLFRQNLRYGFKVYLAAFFAFSLLRIDLLMVQRMRGAAEAGQYAISSSMADMLYLLPSVIGTVLFPKLSATSDSLMRWKMTRQVMFVIAGVMSVASGAALFFSTPLIRLMWGPAFLPAAMPFIILSVAMIFYGSNNALSNYLASEGLPWFAVYVWIIALVMNVGANFLLIPSYGITGAAAASLLGYVLVFVCQYAYATNFAKTR
ncbi:MAG: flippase [Acidobacteria bacterium]|nr:flippase [Acidobacteriota bacterium]